MLLLGGDHGFQLVLEIFEVSGEFVLVLVLFLSDQMLVDVQSLLTPGDRQTQGGQKYFQGGEITTNKR